MSVELLPTETRKTIKKDEKISQWALFQLPFNTMAQTEQSLSGTNQYGTSITNAFQLYTMIQNLELAENMKDIQKVKTPDLQPKKESKLSLSLYAGILSSVIAVTMVILPYPYNVISSLAVCGPLSVSLYGLKKNKN